MADLIEREAKIEVLQDLEYAIGAGMFKRVGPVGPGESNEEFCEALRWAVSGVKDAEPVRHGRWSENYYLSDGIYSKCSECNYLQEYKHKYCPYCGAKMDGGENDG